MSDIHVDCKAIEFIIRNVQQVSGVLNWENIMILIYKNVKHYIHTKLRLLIQNIVLHNPIYEPI